MTYRQFVACILIYLDLEKGESEDSVESFSEGTWSHIQSEENADQTEEVEEADAVVGYLNRSLLGSNQVDAFRVAFFYYLSFALCLWQTFICDLHAVTRDHE